MTSAMSRPPDRPPSENPVPTAAVRTRTTCSMSSSGPGMKTGHVGRSAGTAQLDPEDGAEVVAAMSRSSSPVTAATALWTWASTAVSRSGVGVALKHF